MSCEKFTSKYKVMDNGCWNWHATSTDGYGVFSHGKRHVRAHRHSYELFVGKIPPGLTIDHICRNRLCVNPQHLRVLTIKENVLIGVSPSAINMVKDRCYKGHEFTVDNTSFAKDRHGNRTWRICKECQRIKASIKYYKQHDEYLVRHAQYRERKRLQRRQDEQLS